MCEIKIKRNFYLWKGPLTIKLVDAMKSPLSIVLGKRQQKRSYSYVYFSLESTPLCDRLDLDLTLIGRPNWQSRLIQSLFTCTDHFLFGLYMCSMLHSRKGNFFVTTPTIFLPCRSHKNTKSFLFQKKERKREYNKFRF